MYSIAMPMGLLNINPATGRIHGYPVACGWAGAVIEKFTRAKAAAPNSRCPVGHRGEFPDVLRGNISGLKRLIEVIEDWEGRI